MNFNDEVTAALRLADGVLLVVDAVEGVMMGTDRALRQANTMGCLCRVDVSCALTQHHKYRSLDTSECNACPTQHDLCQC